MKIRFIYSLFVVFSLIFMVACQTDNKRGNMEQYKVEILRTESQFANMVAKKGMAKAFEYYAADDAIMIREGKMIKGKARIKNYIENEPFTKIKLKWVPDFVDVSGSGDLGYTYGKIYLTATDTTGQPFNLNGTFTPFEKSNLMAHSALFGIKHSCFKYCNLNQISYFCLPNQKA